MNKEKNQDDSKASDSAVELSSADMEKIVRRTGFGER